VNSNIGFIGEHYHPPVFKPYAPTCARWVCDVLLFSQSALQDIFDNLLCAAPFGVLPGPLGLRSCCHSSPEVEFPGINLLIRFEQVAGDRVQIMAGGVKPNSIH